MEVNNSSAQDHSARTCPNPSPANGRNVLKKGQILPNGTYILGSIVILACDTVGYSSSEDVSLWYVLLIKTGFEF